MRLSDLSLLNKEQKHVCDIVQRSYYVKENDRPACRRWCRENRAYSFLFKIVVKKMSKSTNFHVESLIVKKSVYVVFYQ